MGHSSRPAPDQAQAESVGSGDHCMDADAVAGSLLCNREIVADAPGLEDLAPTVLAHYDITPPGSMRGKPVLRRT